MPGIGRKSPGFMLADAIIAIAVASILMSTLGVALTKESRASKTLAEQRAQIRLAEQVMTSLQSGAAIPSGPEDFEVNVAKVAQKSEIAPGMSWARVTVKHGAHVAELIGVVPAASIKEKSP